MRETLPLDQAIMVPADSSTRVTLLFHVKAQVTDSQVADSQVADSQVIVFKSTQMSSMQLCSLLFIRSFFFIFVVLFCTTQTLVIIMYSSIPRQGTNSYTEELLDGKMRQLHQERQTQSKPRAKSKYEDRMIHCGHPEQGEARGQKHHDTGKNDPQKKVVLMQFSMKKKQKTKTVQSFTLYIIRESKIKSRLFSQVNLLMTNRSQLDKTC